MVELNFVRVANKLNLSYDFNIKHDMPAVEWKLSAMNNNANV